MSIRPALDTLAATLQRVNAPLFTQLADGLAPGAIAAQLAGLPVAAEVHEYFAWRNGQRADREADHELFPEATMLSLEEAVTDYQMLRDMAAQVARQAGIPASAIWDDRWFPLFRHPAGGAYHVTVAGDPPGSQAKIVFVFLQDVEGAAIAFDSLASMAVTVSECWATGAYTADAGTTQEDRQRAGAIVRAHNPVRVHDATAWLPPSS